MKLNDYKHVDVVDLIPYVNNTRTHDEKQIAQVASSIKEFGFTNPVLIDSDNGIIAGHGRILAAQKLKLEQVPCIVLDGLTDAQKKAYVIADNQLALNAGWDLDKLKLEVENLNELDFDIELLGFDDDFLELITDVECELPSLQEGDRDPFQQKTFTLHDEQADIIDDAITKAKTNPVIDSGINENSNGNAIAYICEQWLNNHE